MIRWPLVIFSFALVILASDYAAARTECAPDDPSKCAVPITKGARAPFSGQLLTPKLAVDLGLKADQCDTRIMVEVDYAKKAAKLDLRLEQALRENDGVRHQQELGAMQANRDRWRDLAATPFYAKPWFIATVTAVVVGGILIGSSNLIKVTVPRWEAS